MSYSGTIDDRLNLPIDCSVSGKNATSASAPLTPSPRAIGPGHYIAPGQIHCDISRLFSAGTKRNPDMRAKTMRTQAAVLNCN